MSATHISSTDFAGNIVAARKASDKGPVFITVDGKAEHVLLSIGDYHRLQRKSPVVGDLLSCEGAEEVDIDVTRDKSLARPAELE